MSVQTYKPACGMIACEGGEYVSTSDFCAESDRADHFAEKWRAEKEHREATERLRAQAVADLTRASADLSTAREQLSAAVKLVEHKDREITELRYQLVSVKSLTKDPTVQQAAREALAPAKGGA